MKAPAFSLSANFCSKVSVPFDQDLLKWDAEFDLNAVTLNTFVYRYKQNKDLTSYYLKDIHKQLIFFIIQKYIMLLVKSLLYLWKKTSKISHSAYIWFFFRTSIMDILFETKKTIRNRSAAKQETLIEPHGVLLDRSSDSQQRVTEYSWGVPYDTPHYPSHTLLPRWS